MSNSRLARFAPLSGIVFVVLLVISFILDNNTPDTDSSAADAVAYWSAHDARAIASAIITAFAVLFLVWFGASLRSALARAEGGEGRLASITYGGVLLLAGTGLLNSSIEFTLGDIASKDNISQGVTETLSVLYSDAFLGFPISFALILLGAGVCALRFGALPRWVGWFGVILGIITLTPVGFFAIPVTGLWVLIVSVLLFRAESAAAPVAPTASPPPPPLAGTP